MRKHIVNLMALVIIATGGLMLTATPASAGSCTGPAGAQACTCTSGDGQMTCTGDSCTSNATSCTYTDAPIQAE